MGETHRHPVDQTWPDAKNYVAHSPAHVKCKTAKPIHAGRNRGAVTSTGQGGAGERLAGAAWRMETF